MRGRGAGDSGRGRSRGRDSDRGQAHALEGVSAALLVVLSLLFALQIVATGPLAASTAREHVSNQLRGAGEGTIAVADERDDLHAALLYWNDTGGKFHGADLDSLYVDRAPPNAFGDLLEATFPGNRTVYNVVLRYRGENDTRESLTMVYSGEPTEGAVTVRRTVTLYDEDRLRAADGSRTGVTISGAGDRFYAEDVAPGPVYNVVVVEVTIWRV